MKEITKVVSKVIKHLKKINLYRNCIYIGIDHLFLIDGMVYLYCTTKFQMFK